jgi:hypothetical protein
MTPAALGGSRVLRPHRGWQTLDFVLAAVALAFLALALGGLSDLLGAWRDVEALQRDCPNSVCVHHGTVAGTYTYFASTYSTSTSYCVLTIALDTGRRQVGLAGRVCSQIPDGSTVDATIWRGKVVIVKTAAGTMGTLENPGTNVGSGVFRMLAIVPVLLLVAMIHVDIANHRVVRRVLRRAPLEP